MRLKSLEIKGFKSFADKTVINFDEGITGVIGPNGCGKSNIIDSIRWVIGEHKISNLRSENLESLVFNGSKTRSASGLAEVSLTFENTKNLLPTEFSTVTITRKYYKSGESEYRLNDVACRLKDIHNLFMDTGVSTDSYAIIELGMVDDIIKDKENSRRRMLEQAAGITIYKTRKKEAKLKLDATQQDLARIEDLLFEINNQLKSLESQAKKAEKYFEIKKDYKETSIELAKAALEGFNVTYKDLNEQQKVEVDKRLAIEAAIAKEDAALESEKLALIETEKTLQTMQQAFNQIQDNVRSKENEKNLSSQRLQYLKETKSSLDNFLQKAVTQVNGLEEGISFTQKQIVDEEKALQNLEQKIAEFKQAVEGKRSLFDEQRSGMDLLRKTNQDLQRSQFDAEKKVAIADTSIQNIQKALAQLVEEQTERSLKISSLKEEKILKDEVLAAAKQKLTELQEQNELTKAKILSTQSILENVRSTLADENRKLDAKTNEYRLLKSLVESMEGYPESVKFLHNNAGWNKDAPLLSDIIYVKEPFRAAVENVLEPYLNYYVVNDLAEGMQAVHLLDEHQKGKANFFLLDKFVMQETHAAPANTIPALGVIEIDDKYNALASHLLGNVFIAEQAEAIENEKGVVILEKTGKFVKGEYAITGGSVGIFEGKKIGRAKNLEKLQEQIEAQTETVERLRIDLKNRHDEVINFNAALKEREIQQKQQEINTLNNEVFSNENKIENLLSQETNAGERIKGLELQLKNDTAAVSSTRTVLNQLNIELAEVSEKLASAEGLYKNAELAYNAATGVLNETNLQIARQQSKLTSLQQELTFKQKQQNELQEQIGTSNIQLKDAEENLEQTSVQVKEVGEALHELMHSKESEGKKLNEFDQRYYVLRNALTAKESSLKQQQKSKEGIDQVLDQIKDKLTELKLQLSGIKERLNVEFKIDIEDILESERIGEESIDDLQEKCERMKKRLENIGEVNPTAVEAYTEMKKRYEFIMEQKNDLVSAKDSLLETIQEVEATANQQFLETFNKTRENFQKVFKALFSDEDMADMVLVDPTNLAETGIDIIAKPKGKRPSSIGQLSGGEKTLTATALLFAIYLIKPAPFCILDEVDAPLDDANVAKFTNMIKQFSENSQFIIVTHNKTTMSAVDVIYGVTMQEAGVSKLVPVDFRSLN